MAFANDVMQQSLNNVQNTPGPMDMMKQGMQLVQLRDQIQNQKAEAIAKQEALETAKFEKQVDFVNKLVHQPANRRKQLLAPNGYGTKLLERYGVSLSEAARDDLINNEDEVKAARWIFDTMKPEGYMALSKDKEAQDAWAKAAVNEFGFEGLFSKFKNMIELENDKRKIEATKAVGLANAERAENNSERKANKDQQTLIANLRKEREGNQTTKDTRDIQSSWERINEMVTNHSPAGDLALLKAFNLMIEPGSRVTDAEFEIAKKSGSLPTKFEAWTTGKIKGELTEKQRSDFFSQAKKMYEAQLRLQAKADKFYVDEAKAAGISPDRIGIRENDKIGPDKVAEGIKAEMAKGKTYEQIKAAIEAKGRKLDSKYDEMFSK